mgnify:CR=1 FL=1
MPLNHNFQYSTEHIALAKQTDLVVAAPATANVTAKLAIGKILPEGSILIVRIHVNGKEKKQ